MLTRDETKIFAWLLKQLGGEVKIPILQLEELDGWEVHWIKDPSDMSLSYKLIRKGVTIDGECSSPPSRGDNFPSPFKGPQVSSPMQVRRPPLHLDVPSAQDPAPERASQSLWDVAFGPGAKRRFFGEEG